MFTKNVYILNLKSRYKFATQKQMMVFYEKEIISEYIDDIIVNDSIISHIKSGGWLS